MNYWTSEFLQSYMRTTVPNRICRDATIFPRRGWFFTVRQIRSEASRKLREEPSEEDVTSTRHSLTPRNSHIFGWHIVARPFPRFFRFFASSLLFSSLSSIPHPRRSTTSFLHKSQAFNPISKENCRVYVFALNGGTGLEPREDDASTELYFKRAACFIGRLFRVTNHAASFVFRSINKSMD